MPKSSDVLQEFLKEQLPSGLVEALEALHRAARRPQQGARAHILLAQAGHVGADNAGVLIAEEPYRQEEEACWSVQ